MFVENHMTREPVTVRPDTEVPKVANLLASNRIRHLPVVDEHERLVGIVTDRDVRSATGYDTMDALHLKAENIMTVDPTTIRGNAPLEDALTILSSRRFGALPVVKAGRLVGIISRHDVLGAMNRLLGLDQSGTRIEVALPDPKTDLAAAFDALGRCDAELISAIASRVRDDGEEPALYLRIAGSNRRAVESELRQAGLILLVPDNEMVGTDS